MMRPWNVVVTVRGKEWGHAIHELHAFGRVGRTPFYNVLLLDTESPRAFLDSLRERSASEPDRFRWLSRAIPVESRFHVRSAEEFEERAREALGALVPALAGKSFHVRVHRRGFKGRLSGHEEERRLAEGLIDALEASGRPGTIRFDDPDFVVAIELVGTDAGVSLWSREDLARYPFLRPD